VDVSQARRGLLKARPDVVFHLAGATRAQPWRELWPSHVLATAQLFEAVLSLPKSQRPKVVVAGSAHEYGSLLALPLRETDSPRPANPYGWSKLIQTDTALAYAALGVEVVVARIFNLVGPGLPETHALASFCRQIAWTEEGRGRGILIRGNLSAGRDFVDARDACRALILLSTYGIPGEIYNVCSGHTTRLRAALSLLLRMARTPIAVRKTDAPRTRRGRRDLMRGSYAKLQARTSWRPTVSLRQSLAEMLAEWRDRTRS
jgi:GDP-4-dehydro-6-deoxy-D-mannose reductase